MNNLSKESCKACQRGAPQLTAAEISTAQQDIPAWDVKEIDGEKRFQRVFSFDDFVAALSFANKVGDLAESNNHHPALTVEWGKVTVQWWTHKINGLHRNDAVMAAKTDTLYHD